MNIKRAFLCLTAAACACGGTLAQAGQFFIDVGSFYGSAPGWDTLPFLDSDGVYPFPFPSDLFNSTTLTDQSGSGDDDVSLFVPRDGDTRFRWSDGRVGRPEVGAFYDGVNVPQEANDDYLFLSGASSYPDDANPRWRFDNIDAGLYNVTLFEGRTNDGTGQVAKIWVGDADGSNEPGVLENTGDFSNGFSTVSVEIEEGDFLWIGHAIDGTGGISGIIINQVPEPTSVVMAGLVASAATFVRRRR